MFSIAVSRRIRNLDLLHRNVLYHQGCASTKSISKCTFGSRVCLPSRFELITQIKSNDLNLFLYRRRLSTTSSHPESTLLVHYQGEFANKLKWLRRVSFGSSVVSVFVIPFVMLTGVAGTGSIPLVGQAVIISTALVTSLSSTLFLHMVTHPYVVSLKELYLENPNKNVDSNGTEIEKNMQVQSRESSDRQLTVTRINVMGMFEETKFNLSEASRNQLSNPFASVKIQNKHFYIFGGNISDEQVRKALCNEQ